MLNYFMVFYATYLSQWHSSFSMAKDVVNQTPLSWREDLNFNIARQQTFYLPEI